MNNRETFQHVKNWMEQIQINAAADVVVVIIGNKADLSMEVTQEEATEMANSYKVPYYSVSAKTGENINSVFESLAMAFL